MTDTFLSSLKQPRMTPIGRRSNGTVIYNLDADYEYIWSGPYGIKRKIVVRKGYRSDGASVPRIAWSLSGVTPDGLIRAAALVHDLICEYKGDLPEGSYYEFVNNEWLDMSWKHWPSKVANKLFGRIMREADVSKTKRRLAYLGVSFYRLIGGLGW